MKGTGSLEVTRLLDLLERTLDELLCILETLAKDLLVDGLVMRLMRKEESLLKRLKGLTVMLENATDWFLDSLGLKIRALVQGMPGFSRLEPFYAPCCSLLGSTRAEGARL
jgi:hypothetical protein